MAVFERSAAKRVVIALLICMFLAVTAVSSPTSDNVQQRISESFAKVVQADIWLLNDSLKALVEPTQSNTFLVSVEDGTVQAWRKKSDSALWSFSSGPPLTSFRSFSNRLEVEEDAEDEYEEEWDVEGSRVSVMEDGSRVVACQPEILVTTASRIGQMA